MVSFNKKEIHCAGHAKSPQSVKSKRRPPTHRDMPPGAAQKAQMKCESFAQASAGQRRGMSVSSRVQCAMWNHEMCHVCRRRAQQLGASVVHAGRRRAGGAGVGAARAPATSTLRARAGACVAVSLHSLGAAFSPCSPTFSADPTEIFTCWFVVALTVLSGPISSTFDILRVNNAKRIDPCISHGVAHYRYRYKEGVD